MVWIYGSMPQNFVFMLREKSMTLGKQEESDEKITGLND